MIALTELMESLCSEIDVAVASAFWRYKNTSLISAVIELNTRQALKTGRLQVLDDRISANKQTTDRRTFDETTLDDELMQTASETTKTGYDGVVENMKKVQELSNPDLIAENSNKNPAHPDDEDGPNL